MEQKGKSHIIVPVLVLVLVVIYYFNDYKFASKLHPDQTAEDMAQLTQMVSREIDEGKSKGVFYLNGITEDELAKINESVCSMNGNVEKYSITERGKNGMRITLHYAISDNYYVYQKYLGNGGIPSDHASAYKLYDKVEEVLASIIKPGMSDYDKELAIHDYIVKNCKYGYVETSKDYAYRAYGALVQKTAVCNGYAEAFALLLSCVGVENQIITGTADGELHAWNLVKLDGDWYQVDATWDDPLPDRGSFVGHAYFNVTDDIMDVRHDWNKENFPACKSKTENYYVKNDLIIDTETFHTRLMDDARHNCSATVEYVLTDYRSDMDFSFLQAADMILYFKYADEPYGSDTLLTIYLNQR
ncbi:MAG: transglutaminase domain-containing protein [Wujia sp.]